MGLDVNERLRRVLDHVAARRPDAYLFTGDFCAAEPDAAAFALLADYLSELGAPWYVSPGNHDDRALIRQALDLPGQDDEPHHRAVTVNDREFLILDSVPARVDDDQLAWLSDRMIARPNADIVVHHPPLPLGVRFMDEKYPIRDDGRLLKVLLADGRPRRVFCGHYHSHRTVTHANVTVHLCPPTSFFINPDADEFQQDNLPPAYLWLEWTADGSFRAAPTFVPPEKARS